MAAGKHDAHFPVDIYQTGSGTSTNMNGNEVIANLANQKLGFGLSAKNNPDAVHPNDHVNAGQSSNDTFPTGMHIAGALAIENDLKPALDRLRDGLAAKAEAWDKIVKIGRTHLMDATPIRVGQVFAGYARQAEHARHRAGFAFEGMRQNSGDRRHGRGHGHQHAPRVCRQGVRCPQKTHGHRFSRGRAACRGPGREGLLRAEPRVL